MGIYITDDTQKMEIRTCLGGGCGCVHFSSTEYDVYVSVRDRCKDSVETELSVKLKKRENYDEIIHEIYRGNSVIWNEPRADEGEMLNTLRYVADKLKHGVKYVGVKLEYTSPRGFEVLFRLRYSEKEGQYVIELTAEKDGEKLRYYAYGSVNDYRLLLEEAAKAIAAYVLFSDFIETNQSGGSGSS